MLLKRRSTRSFAHHFIHYVITRQFDFSLYPCGDSRQHLGLVITFLGLTTHVIHLEWIYFGSSLLIRYMAVLFVPVSVGIIKYYDLLVAQWKVLLIQTFSVPC